MKLLGILKQNIFSIIHGHQFGLLLCFVFLLVSCKGGEDEVEPQKTKIEITVVYPVNGLGDCSYSDLINLTVSLVTNTAEYRFPGTSILYHFVSPNNTDEAKSKLQNWDDTPPLNNYTYHMLILADEMYEDMMVDINKWREDSRRDVLVLNRHNYNDSRTYYRDLPLYGPAWESGYMAKKDGDKPALLLANNYSHVMIDARQGWLDGYAAAGGNPDEVPVVDDVEYEESRCAEASDSLFNAGYDNVVCINGGGQMGALRSLVFRRTLFGGDYNNKRLTVCENAYPKSYYGPYIRYQIFKKTGDVVLVFLENWISWRTGTSQTKPDQIVVYDMLNYSLDDYVLGLLDPTDYYTAAILCDKDIRGIAAEAEQKYYNRK